MLNAGRDGKKFFNMLKEENKKKVVAFCDIDQKKIGAKYQKRERRKKEKREIGGE